MAKRKNTIKGEMAKIVRKKVSSSYMESLGLGNGEEENVTILRAIALAQVKKGLEGDLKATEFIEKLLDTEEENTSVENFGVVVRVVGGEDGA